MSESQEGHTPLTVPKPNDDRTLVLYIAIVVSLVGVVSVLSLWKFAQDNRDRIDDTVRATMIACERGNRSDLILADLTRLSIALIESNKNQNEVRKRAADVFRKHLIELTEFDCKALKEKGSIGGVVPTLPGETTPKQSQIVLQTLINAATPEQLAFLRGLSGPIGPRGARGSQGPQGRQGERGAPGDRGPRGDRGVRGDRGPRGLLGLPGSNGQTPALGDVVQETVQGTLDRLCATLKLCL